MIEKVENQSDATQKENTDIDAEEKKDKAPMSGKDIDPTRFGDWEKNGRCVDF